jgi:chemotaxis protein methyltransferase CheR
MVTARNGHDLLAVEGEFAFTWEDFRHIADLVHGEAGIVLPKTKANLVYSRLSKRLRAIGLKSFRDYCALVERGESGERAAMISAMTTNVTRFFREAHHFAHLRDSVMPKIADAARRGEKVRLWSAGCSSGEEPYSIAMTLLSAIPDAPSRDVLILATDIDQAMLDHAAQGVYPRARLDDIPKALQSHVTAGGPDRFRIGDAARALVCFKPLNLLKPWPLRAQFHAIFCRNVMIYFDQETQDAIWSRFAERLPAGGTLYIGHSERVGAGLPFVLAGQTTYRRSAP